VICTKRLKNRGIVQEVERDKSLEGRSGPRHVFEGGEYSEGTGGKIIFGQEGGVPPVGGGVVGPRSLTWNNKEIGKRPPRAQWKLLNFP